MFVEKGLHRQECLWYWLRVPQPFLAVFVGRLSLFQQPCCAQNTNWGRDRAVGNTLDNVGQIGDPLNIGTPNVPDATGRNLLVTPGLQQWDFSATKNTRIRGRHSFEFRFEAFNFLNHPNYNTPSVDVRTPATFGRITSARTMREMQIGLKYIF